MEGEDESGLVILFLGLEQEGDLGRSEGGEESSGLVARVSGSWGYGGSLSEQSKLGYGEGWNGRRGREIERGWAVLPLNTSVDGGLRQMSVPGGALILKEDIVNVLVNFGLSDKKGGRNCCVISLSSLIYKGGAWGFNSGVAAAWGSRNSNRVSCLLSNYRIN